MEKLRYYGKKLLYYEQNYGIMHKTIVLYQELWSFNFWRKKIWLITKNKETLIYNRKINAYIPKQLKFLNKLIALKFRFTMEYYGTMEKKYGTTEKNYGTMEKTMVL